MVKEIQYTSIRRVLDAVAEHPMLSDVTLEQVVRHTVRFIGLHGYPKLYQDKIGQVDIKEFRGVLPCDLISITQAKDCRTGVCMRSMTDSFTPGLSPSPTPPLPSGELTFKTQGSIIFTSFPKGRVEIAYKAIPVDEDGLPLIIDNENFLAALEAYIKKQVFTVKFDIGKIQSGVLQNAKQEYAFLAAQLRDEFVIPSYSEMEAYSRAMTHLIPQVRNFESAFKHLGDKEYLRVH